MKTRIVDGSKSGPRWTRLIACFGRARLVERADGRAELRGASRDEETEAKEWISLFEHEAVLHVARGPDRGLQSASGWTGRGVFELFERVRSSNA